MYLTPTFGYGAMDDRGIETLKKTPVLKEEKYNNQNVQLFNSSTLIFDGAVILVTLK